MTSLSCFHKLQGVRMFLYFAVFILWLVYKWLVRDLDYYEKLGIAHEKPLPVLGHMLSFILKKESLIALITRHYEKFKKAKIFGWMNFMQITFTVTDADLMKQITIKDFDHFVNHNGAITQADKLLDRTLFALHDKEWKDMRSTLSPIFTSSKMKMMYGLLSHQALDFVKYFEERANRGEKIVHDVLDLFSRFTADGISTAVMGFEADCVRNENSSIYKFVQKLLHDFMGPIGGMKFLLSFSFPKLYKLLGLQLVSQEVKDFLHRAVIQTMDERDRLKTSRPDVIQLMLQAKKGQLKNESEVNDKELSNFAANVEYDVGTKKNTSAFTDDDWLAQGFIFFTAGFDTTSNLLQTLFFELVKNPEVQRELQSEIDDEASTLGDNPISYEALHKMKFLDMVISETLRKWPPAPVMDRECTKDYELDLGNGKKFTIKKGQIVNLPFFALQHDERYFPNPEKFDPHRFSDENKELIIPGSYNPFGSGPRVCIGSRFALMEAKLLVFNLLQKFSVAECAKTPKSLSYDTSVNLRIKERVFLQFNLRK